jgi:hypothetical protein
VLRAYGTRRTVRTCRDRKDGRPMTSPAQPSTYEQLEHVISKLDMTPDKREWMKDRWLAQVRWFDRKAVHANRWHSVLRVVAIGGGVLIPGLVSANAARTTTGDWDAFKVLTFSVSLLVAAAVGLDEFFHFGERWRHFRRTAELLKMEGWLFIEGAGRYRNHQHRADFHERFFPLFATKVEELVKRDVEVYLTRIVQEKQDDHEQEDRDIREYLDAGNSRTDTGQPVQTLTTPSTLE